MSTGFVYPVIDMRATGTHIKELMTAREVTVQDVQDAMGLASPQAVYLRLTISMQYRRGGMAGGMCGAHSAVF